MVRRVPSKHQNTLVSRETESGAFARLALLLICGLVLAGGFVYAGGRHFAALKIGYQTQKLRTDLEKAREEQRRLMLEREAAVSPARLEIAARKLGMQPMQPAQIDPLKRANESASVKIDSQQSQSPAKIPAKPKLVKQAQDQKKHR
jgi:cell division protein FtsL